MNMHELMDDKLHEECGVFGIYNTEHIDVAPYIYYGLTSLQHRGQESAGIAVCDTGAPAGNITWHKGMGLVSEVFHQERLSSLKGNLGIGHVRYSTTGSSCIENAQPMVGTYSKGTLALAHNGNITNAEKLKKELMDCGTIFHSTSDTEVVYYLIARERSHTDSVENAIKTAVTKLKGGYALVVISPQKLIGVRDPLGLKPLCLGKSASGYVLASESSALTAIGATFIRDIAPGEIITITGNGYSSNYCTVQHTPAHCIFEYIYFSRLDSHMDGIPIYDAREKAGRLLAKAYPIDADIVSGVPDSGLTAAMGYAKESGIPYSPVFQKNSYIGRTFIKPTQEERESAVRLKLSVLDSVVAGKRIILIDDSIVRGTTMASLIRLLKNAGAKEVHVRISSPPFLYPCYYGTDVPTGGELIAHQHSPEEICNRIGADSLGYLKLNDLSEMVDGLPICKACFDGNYPQSPY